MGRIDKPWGYEEQVLITQVDVDDTSGMLGVRRIVINSDEMTSYSFHDQQADILYLEKGDVVLRLEDRMKELEKGDARVIRSGQKHQLQNIGSEVAKLLEISFPYRPEDITRVEDPYSGKREKTSE
ncbi:MAG: cupin domain-containing protein [Candidatus Nanohaloarchaea archaeon]